MKTKLLKNGWIQISCDYCYLAKYIHCSDLDSGTKEFASHELSCQSNPMNKACNTCKYGRYWYGCLYTCSITKEIDMSNDINRICHQPKVSAWKKIKALFLLDENNVQDKMSV